MRVIHSHPVSDMINAILEARKEIPLNFPEPTQADLLVAVKIYDDFIHNIQAVSEEEVPDIQYLLSLVMNSNKPPQVLEGLSYACWYLAERAGQGMITSRALSVQIYRELVRQYKIR